MLSPSPFQPAIDELEKELANVERQRNGLLSTIGFLREKAGQSPRPPSGDGGLPFDGSGSQEQSPVSIQHDTFFGKKMSTSARLYLEMRKKAGGQAPATPKEILTALKEGGHQFETKDDHVAGVSLRNMLRKYTTIFQKLPNGTYGLKAWYPDARKPRASTSHAVEPIAEEVGDAQEGDVSEQAA